LPGGSFNEGRYYTRALTLSIKRAYRDVRAARDSIDGGTGIKVAINTLGVAPGQWGGGETFVVNLVNKLVDIDRENKLLLVVSRSNEKLFPTAGGNVEHLRYNFDNSSRIIRVLFEQFVLPWSLWRKKVNLLIAPCYTGLIYSPCPVVLIVHDFVYFVYPKSVPMAHRVFYRGFVPYSCRKANKVAVVSSNTKEDAIRYTGIDEDKIGVIYDGVDYEVFANAAQDVAEPDILKQYGIDRSYIFSPSSLYEHKNNDSLIKAFAKLQEKYKVSHKLVITGFDPANRLELLKHLIHEHGLDNEVLYLGRVPKKHMPLLYSKADITVCLSAYEGFGLPVVEAMAAGCPVLSSDRSSLPEVVGDGGVLVDPFDIDKIVDKMHLLLTSKALRRECIQKGRLRAKHFSWDKVAQNLIDIYTHL